MYTIIKNKINNNKIGYQFKKQDDSKLTYAEFINLLRSKDENFLGKFREALNDGSSELSAYFWECVPVSRNTINKEFEFVLTKSEALNIKYVSRQNYSSFQEHFNKSRDNQVVSFPNLRGDANLIVPIPKRDSNWDCGYNEKLNYISVSKFTENAPTEQQWAFWQEVGNKMSENLNSSNNVKWLSTHGLGVYYLHVRIDSEPKYYQHQEYKVETQQQQETPPKNPFRGW